MSEERKREVSMTGCGWMVVVQWLGRAAEAQPRSRTAGFGLRSRWGGWGHEGLRWWASEQGAGLQPKTGRKTEQAGPGIREVGEKNKKEGRRVLFPLGQKQKTSLMLAEGFESASCKAVTNYYAYFPPAQPLRHFTLVVASCKKNYIRVVFFLSGVTWPYVTPRWLRPCFCKVLKISIHLHIFYVDII